MAQQKHTQMMEMMNDEGFHYDEHDDGSHRFR
jgi:hypothetical protein